VAQVISKRGELEHRIAVAVEPVDPYPNSPKQKELGPLSEYVKDFSANEGRSNGPRLMGRVLVTKWMTDRLSDFELEVAFALWSLLRKAEDRGSVSRLDEEALVRRIESVKVRRSVGRGCFEERLPWHPSELRERDERASRGVRGENKTDQTGLPESGPVPCPFGPED
jgi:hypothetical protein